MRKLILALFLITALAPATARSEVGPVTRFLMQDPMTMWDWGMYRLNEHVKWIAEGPFKEFKFVLPSADYYDDADVITLHFWSSDDDLFKKKSCPEFMESLKTSFAVDPSGNPYAKKKYSTAAGYFRHQKHVSRGSDNYLVEIDRRIHLWVYNENHACRSYLRSGEVDFRNEGFKPFGDR